jgi:hypothetical protein
MADCRVLVGVAVEAFARWWSGRPAEGSAFEEFSSFVSLSSSSSNEMALAASAAIVDGLR